MQVEGRGGGRRNTRPRGAWTVETLKSMKPKQKMQCALNVFSLWLNLSNSRPAQRVLKQIRAMSLAMSLADELGR